jgi:hypothetical protein
VTITSRIEEDFRSLEAYFQRLLELRDELVRAERKFPIVADDVGAEKSQAEHFYVSHLIKPDMIIGTYSCFEFWIQKVCEFHKSNSNLTLSYKDIRGKNDLHAYSKYLTLVAGLNLSSAQTSYQRLDDLRKVRNILVHNGGHVTREKEKELFRIDGISVAGSLVVITDEFVRDVVTHARSFAVHVAKPIS